MLSVSSYHHLSILFFYIVLSNFKKDQKEWKLVAEKAECVAPQHSGHEGWKGYLSDVDSCAEACKGESSMFTFGTNDFGFKKCRYNETIHDVTYDGCQCRCQLLVHSNGTCDRGTSGSPGYRLYKIQKGIRIVIGIESTYKFNFSYIRKSQLSLQIFLNGLKIFQVVSTFMSEVLEPILK